MSDINKPNQTPIAELAQKAREHYDEVTKNDVQMSVIRDAINLWEEIETSKQHYRTGLANGTIIEDGFGSATSVICPACGEAAMQAVRPGKFQCGECD